eukprot:m.55701 g.55701  ORF g.55701 m.55701 type:complete len:225 (+) comp10998_c0_seq1:218-892(+)
MGCGSSKKIEEAITIAREERERHVATQDKLVAADAELNTRASEIKRLQEDTLVHEQWTRQQAAKEKEKLTEEYERRLHELSQKLLKSINQTELAREDAKKSREAVIVKQELEEENRKIEREILRIRNELEKKKEDERRRNIIFEGQKEILRLEQRREMEMIEKKNSQLRDDCAKEVARMQKVVDETNDLKRQAEIEARRQTEASLVNMRAGGMPHGTGGALSPS